MNSELGPATEGGGLVEVEIEIARGRAVARARGARFKHLGPTNKITFQPRYVARIPTLSDLPSARVILRIASTIPVYCGAAPASTVCT